MQDQYQVEVFFDGDCPLCVREIRFLKRRDRQHRIGFIDIAAEEFDASVFGLTQRDFMERIRARLADGSMIEGVEVFRRLYAAVGFGWLVWCTRLPGVSQLLDVCYSWFARNRLRLTGRCGDSCAIPEDRSETMASRKVSA